MFKTPGDWLLPSAHSRIRRQLGADEDVSNCRLLSGAFADFVQLSLAAVALGALIVKRFQETPQRPWKIWWMDVSKQCLGSLYAHFINMLLAMGLSSLTGGGDQCAWYFVNFMVDSSIGVVLCLIFIKLAECWASWQPPTHWARLYISESGNYGNPPQFDIWKWQTLIWLAIVSVSKFGLFFFLLAFDDKFSYWGHWIFKPLKHHPEAELVIVMVVVPGIANVAQFWILDNLLKSNVDSAGAGTGGPLSPSKEHFKVSYEPILEGSSGSGYGGGGPGSLAAARRRKGSSSSQDGGVGAGGAPSWFRPWEWSWSSGGGGPGAGLASGGRGGGSAAVTVLDLNPTQSSLASSSSSSRSYYHPPAGILREEESDVVAQGGKSNNNNNFPYQQQNTNVPAWISANGKSQVRYSYGGDDGSALA